MLQKILACLMAVIIVLSVFTTTVYFAADSVLVVNPSDRKSSSGQLGMVEEEVVDIPTDLLESLSSEDSSSLQSSSSSPLISQQPSSVIVPPSAVPSNSSTVTIPSSIPSKPSSSSHTSSSSSSSSDPAPPQETLIVKIASESSVGVYAVNDILPRIVAMEMNGSMADEALKAQAVATHSYIKYQNGIGKAPVVYVRTPSAHIKSLVESVSNKMMYSGGRVINAAYCASAAGRTESSVDVWGGYLSYLVSVESTYDYLDPNWGSTITYTVDQVKNMVKKNAGITLSDDTENWFKITSRTTGGYNGDMTIDGHSTFTYNGKTYKITGKYMREIIMKQSGLPTLKSAKFDVSVDGDRVIFTTYGYGHGVGMSQWGAHYYAVKAGYTYKQILTHYYTGVTIQ